MTNDEKLLFKAPKMTQSLFDLEAIPTDTPTPARIMQGRTGRAARYAAQLAWALGDGREWEYRGECWELEHSTGKCACGQIGLRFQFRIHHTKSERTAVVGSSCIETYEGITPELVTRLTSDLDRLQKVAALRITQAKNAARDAKVQELFSRWSAAEYELDSLCRLWRNQNPSARYSPHAIYMRGNYAARLDAKEERDAAKMPHPRAVLPGLKTAAGQMKRIEQELKNCEIFAAEIRKALR